MKNGCFVISLDFEMMWGNLESWTVEGYGQTNISNVRRVVDNLLEIFKTYQIHSTFATVGLLMMNEKEAKAYRHINPPSYDNPKMSPFVNGNIMDVKDKSLYYAPDIVEKLKNYSLVEIGTHTFSHFYCWEDGQTIEQFENDIASAVQLATKNGIELRSIIFPRNNVSREYLQVCKKMGITSYRGNPDRFFAKKRGLMLSFQRMLRLLDVYLGFGNSSSYQVSEIDITDFPINIRASRFLRPYNHKLRFLEGLRLRRIKNEMIRAAKKNEVYHLWWHPHNFGSNMEKNFNFLIKVLDCYVMCREKYGMASLTMNELCCELTQNPNAHK